MAQCMRDSHPHLALNGAVSHRGDTRFARDGSAEIVASICKIQADNGKSDDSKGRIHRMQTVCDGQTYPVQLKRKQMLM